MIVSDVAAADQTSLHQLLHAFRAVDPHAAVLNAACEDLAAAGLTQLRRDGWYVRRDLLELRAATLPTIPIAAPSLAEARMLLRVRGRCRPGGRR